MSPDDAACVSSKSVACLATEPDSLGAPTCQRGIAASVIYKLPAGDAPRRGVPSFEPFRGFSRPLYGKVKPQGASRVPRGRAANTSKFRGLKGFWPLCPPNKLPTAESV